MQFRQSLAIDNFSIPTCRCHQGWQRPRTCAATRAVWVDPLVLGKKTDTRQAEPVDFLVLFRGNRALDPNEAFAGAEDASRSSRASDVWKHGGQKFDRFVLSMNSPGSAENRHHLDVSRQNLTIAIENIGSCGGNGIGGRTF